MARIKNFLRNESGLELSEYVVATALVTLALIFAFTSLASSIINVITELVNRMTP